MEVITKATP